MWHDPTDKHRLCRTMKCFQEHRLGPGHRGIWMCRPLEEVSWSEDRPCCYEENLKEHASMARSSIQFSYASYNSKIILTGTETERERVRRHIYTPSRAEPSQAKADRGKPSQAERRAEPSHAHTHTQSKKKNYVVFLRCGLPKQRRTKPRKAKPSRAEPSQPKPKPEPEPGRAQPSPSQAKPSPAEGKKKTGPVLQFK